MTLSRGFAAGLLLAALAGCGGGGGTASPSSGPAAGQGSDTTLTIGNFTTRVSGTTQQPISVAGSGATISGVAGGTISSLTLTNPTPTPANNAQTLAQTHILLNHGGSIYTIDTFGGSLQALSTSATDYENGAGSWSPDGTKIVYCDFDFASGLNQIYSMNANGTGVARLTDGTGSDTAPVWNSAGTKIAFSRYTAATGAQQIYTMNANGSGAVNLSDGTSIDYQPTWAPAGDRLAFTRLVSGGHQIFIMNSNGSGVHNAAPAYASYDINDAAWSPDGQKIACTLQRPGVAGESTVSVMRADGQTIHSLVPNGETDFHPSWSPDGTKLVYTKLINSSGQYDTCIINIDGNQGYSLGLLQSDISWPSWSPYVRFRWLVGSGRLANSAAGFLAGQQGSVVNSLVLFNATTPNTAFLSTPATLIQGQVSIAITVTADLLTSLIYTNKFAPATTVLTTGTTATGAVVTFDANDGTVSTVLPFNANKSTPRGGSMEHKGDELILRRSFTAVWDSKGKNLAPSGASEVRVNARTGKLISFK